MEMSSLNISLPKPLKDFVEAQTNAGSYSTPSEYLRDLIREDQKRKAQDQLEALLLEGLHSGKPVEANAAFWDDMRTKLLKRLEQTKKKS
jgi:antitoxin ParD1/3/4